MTSTMKKTTFKTPQGIAQYPWLNRPDTQFDADGQYKVNIRVKKDAAQSLIDEIKKITEDAFGAKAKSATLPFVNDEETGDIIFKTKSKYQPSVVDSSGTVIPSHSLPPIYGGSQLKVAGTLSPYDKGGRVGISMQLGGVQIISLSENANTVGIQFGEVEGGYVAANDNEEAPESEQSYNF